MGRQATPAEIKTAYRKLALRFHPDRNSDPSAEDRFKSISVAYETLSTPRKKQHQNSADERASPNYTPDMFGSFFSTLPPFPESLFGMSGLDRCEHVHRSQANRGYVFSFNTTAMRNQQRGYKTSPGQYNASEFYAGGTKEPDTDRGRDVISGIFRVVCSAVAHKMLRYAVKKMVSHRG